MNLVPCGYRMHRLYALKCFQPNLGFEFWTEFSSVFIGHVLDRFSGLGLTIPPVQFSGSTSLTPSSSTSSSTIRIDED
jgi:hypothetical protein